MRSSEMTWAAYKKHRDRGEYDNYEREQASSLSVVDKDEETRRRYQEYVRQMMESQMQDDIVRNDINNDLNALHQGSPSYMASQPVNGMQVENGQAPGAFDPQAARAKAEPRIRAEQAYANFNAELQKADPNYNNLSAAEKYNMFADEIKRQQVDASRSQGMREWASRLNGDPEFDRMSEEEKQRQYMRNLERIADENGTLPEAQRAELSEYKYNGLTDKERGVIDSVMRAESEDFDAYINGGESGVNQFADPTGRGAYSQQRYNEASQAAESRKAARERTLEDARKELKHLGWDDAKIDKELSRYMELADWNKTQEKAQEKADMLNDPSLSSFEKAMVGAGYTAGDILSFLPRNMDTLRSSLQTPGAYGRNTSSKYSYTSRMSEAGTSAVRDTIESPVGQTLYDMGVSSGESMATMLMARTLGPFGETATLLPFAVSAYDSGYRDAVNRGFSERQAEGYGVFVGGLEALTEKLPFDKLGKMAEGKKVGRNLITRALAQMGIEGAEEMTSELGQAAGDWLAVKIGKTGKTQFQLDVESLMSQGMSEQEARDKAIKDFTSQVIMAGVVGAGSALPNTAIASTAGGIHNAMRGGDINQAISERYNSLELEGNSAYEQKLKEDKERYANNPTQFIVDQYKVEDKEGERIKAGLQEIADKEREGKKLSASDKAFISENAQIDQAFINNLYDITDESDVPYEYRSVRTDVTEDEARTRLAEAAAKGDAAAFTDAINLIQNAKDDTLRENSTKIIDEYSGMAQSHGITAEAIGQAQMSRAQAYREGLKGNQAENLSPENQMAYNEGMKAGIEARAKTIVSSKEAMDSASVGKKDGSMVKLTGQFDQNGIVTSDGESIGIDDLDVSSESATLKAYEYADNYKNVNTKNEFLRGIKDGTNIREYNRDFQKAYDFGMSGVSEETMKQGYSTLDDEQMRIAYEAGQREARVRATDELNKAWGVAHNAEGVTYNEAEITDKKALELADSIAAKLGADLHITSELDRSNARGAYKTSENAIYVRSDRLIAVAHEIGEFTETFNKGGYDDLKRVIADLSAKKFGADRYHKMLQQYKDLYGAAGQENSADEMTGEMFNDSISAMFSTEESAQLLADYLAGNYDPQQAKTLGQKAAGVAKRLANTIKKLVSPDNMSGNETDYAKAVYEIADDLSKHAADFLKVLDTAIQNSKKAQGVGTNEVKNSFELNGNKYEVNQKSQVLIDSNGNEIPIIDMSVFDTSLRGTPAQTKRQFAKILTNYIRDTFRDKVFTIKDNGHKIEFAELSKEFATSRSSFRKNNASMARKANIAPRLQTVIENAIFDHHEDNTEGYKAEKARGMDKYNIRISYPTEDGYEIYTGTMDIALHENGKEYFFDIVNIEEEPSSDTTQGGVSNLDSSSSNTNIAEIEEKVNEITEEMAVHYDAQDEMVYPTDYSLETWNASEYQQDRKAAAKELSKALGITQKKALQYIDDINSIAKIIADDRVRLDYDSDEGSAVVSNADYGASVDFSTICKKRLLYTGTLQQIQKQIGNRVITVDDYLAIRQAMIRDNLETTCGCCYLEGSRAKLGGFMKEFIKKYAKKNPQYVPTMYDVSTPDGLRNLRAKHPEVFEAREYFLNHYGKIDANDKETLFASQQKPKDYTERKAYRGEILKMFKGKNAAQKVAEKNLNGGFRLQSFSDFEVVNLLDLMQVITDMSRVGLAGQAYTKVKNFADALGNTGLKINLSLMAKGVDKNGNLILDEINGMKKSDAEYLRNKYSKNVGTIIVCFTDEQIKAAMKDNMIDFIIPFHRPQWQKSQYEALGLPEGTKDYTNYQEDGVIGENGRRRRADHSYMSKEYWDFSKSGRENAETYINMCNDNNKVPVFDFLLEKKDGKYVLPEGADGYFKLLIDFKMYDNDGVGSPQVPVKPDFSLDECRQMLMDYEGGHETFPVDQKIADEFTKKITKREKEFKYSLEADTEGHQLTEGQADYFKDSQIRDDQGRLKVMYHGTPNDFTVFDPKKLGGKNGTAEGYGIYFTDNPEVSQAYGNRQLKGYLNVTNPARSDAKTIKANDLTKLIKATAEAQAQEILEEGYDSVEEAIKDSWVSNMENTYDKPMDQVYRIVAQKILNMNSNDMDIIQEIMADIAIRDYEDAYEFYAILQNTLGIDGYITEWEDSKTGEKSEIVVAFNSNQFKNMDNENPTESEDIRYSLNLESNASEEDVDKALSLGAGEDVKYSIEVKDKKTLEFLENQKHIKTYRTFQKIGDGLYAPMNAMDGKNLGYKSRIGVWEQATEDPSKAVKRGNGYAFPLKAGNATTSGKSRTTWAAYNPYLHSSNLVFNDQFSAAYDRPNLVVVECEVPVSEETSGYKADKAKDSVGWLDWKSGKVANALKKKGMERKVFLSRWMKPVRILSNAEVADIYKESLEGTGIVVPWNVVSPPLREELEKRGVDIDYGYQSSVKASYDDKFSLDLGYHAGDLGKAESLAQQGAGRGTGHFGTGTYFVGDEAKISGDSSYAKRPHYTVDFSKYNLYRPLISQLGYDLHEFLKGVDSFYDMGEDAIKSEREWEKRKDELEYVLDRDNFEGKTITKADALKEARALFGRQAVSNAIAHELGNGYWYGADDTVYEEATDKTYTYEEIVEDWDWERFADMIAEIIWDNRYAPDYITKYESFNRSFPWKVMDLFGISEERARTILKDIKKEIEDSNYSYDEMKVADSAATRFMKALGYEGIDVRGLKGLDNTTYGSVIYDLKGEDLEQKIANGARYSLEVDSDGKKLTEGQQRYFNNSKVVDDQGRLKVMYHGTEQGGFTVFDPEFSDDKRSLFFSDNRDVAESYVEGYSHRIDVNEKFTQEIKDVDAAIEYLKFIGYKDFVRTQQPNLPDGTESIRDLDSMAWAKHDYYSFVDDHGNKINMMSDGILIDYAEVRRRSKHGTYEVYLNIENPLVIDAGGNAWNRLTGKHLSELSFDGDWEVINLSTLRNENGKYQIVSDYVPSEMMTLEEIADKFGQTFADIVKNSPDRADFNNIVYNNVEKTMIPNDTRTAALIAKSGGYDGVIIKNVKDSGGKGAGSWSSNSKANKPSAIAIAFNPEQVKDIDNLNPTSSEDIRYALDLAEDEGGWVDFGAILSDAPRNEAQAVEILKEGMEALKNEAVDVPKLRNLALKLRNEFGSSYNVNELTENLEKAFAYMQTEDHVDYKTMMGILKDIARPVIEASGEKIGENEYKDFISKLKGYKIRLTKVQKDEVASILGSYGAYCRAMMPLTISDKGDVTLDEIWDEIVEATGYALDRDANEGSMPLNLLDTLTAMRPVVRNDFGGDIEDVSRDLAMRIVEEYVEGAAATKMKKEITEIRNRLKKQYSERMKNAQGKANAEVRARNKQRAEQAKEREDVRRLRHDVKLNVKKLYKWITNPTEGKSVPHDLVTPIMQFLNAFDFVDPDIRQLDDGRWHTRVFQRVDYENGQKKFVYKDLYGATREDVLKQFNEAVGRGEGTKEQKYWAQSMQGMKEIYDQVLNDEDFEDNNMDFLMQTLDAEGLTREFDDLLARNKDSVSMNHLDSKDLSLIDNIVKNIFHAVNQKNKAYTMNADIVNLAQDTIKDAEGREIKSRNKFMDAIYRTLRIDNATPRTFFKLLGRRGIDVYKSMRNGLNTEIKDIKKASEFMEEASKGIDKKEINKWTGRDAVIHEVALTNGTIRMTDGQIMGLYRTLRRNGAIDRIKGGIKAGDLIINGRKVQQGVIHLTDQDIKKLEAILTPEQKAFADKMQKYMADDCSKDGNEVSMNLYGFKKFTDPTYYPWTVDKDTVATTNTSENIPMFTGIERSGFTKQLKEGANNPLVINDIFDVFTKHVADMAAYHGYAASVKDVLRWMNYREKAPTDGGFVRWITNKNAINVLSGHQNGIGYIRNLLLDINKANSSRYIGNFTDVLIGNYKAAAVGANARVVIQQPTAYFRALNMIDAKYLLTINPVTAIRNIKKSQEECPISWWKSKGYYETNLGQPIKEIVTGVASPMQRVKDIMMAPAGWADDFTWGFLYTAVEREQRAKLKGQNLTDEQFRKAVNDRFDELVDNTQVVDSTLHRSQYMRSTDRLNKLQTAFMAEPTKTYNMVMEAIVEDLNDGKTMKRAARATGAFLITAIVNSAAQAVMDALRRSGDDDDWWEKFEQYLKSNFSDNINPLNMLPVVKDIAPDIFNLFTGESSWNKGNARFDLDALSSVTDALSAWMKFIEGNGNKTGYGMYMATIKPISQITGIPVYNLSRDAVALYNAFFDNLETTVTTGNSTRTEKKKAFVKNVDKKKDAEVIEESVTDAINKGVSIYDMKNSLKSEYKQAYFDAYMEGDEEKARDIANKAAGGFSVMGMTDEEIDEEINSWQDEVVTYSALDKAIADGEGIIEEVQHVLEAKDPEKVVKHLMDRFTSTVDYEDSHDTESTWRDNVETALRAVDPTLSFDAAKEEAAQKAAQKAEEQAIQEHNSEMKADFFDAVERKDGSAGRKALETMKNEGIEGKTVKSAVSTRYHEIWKEAKTQAEKDKAKSDWKSAYTLVNNVYGTESKDLDKTWSDWESKQ